MGTLKVLNHNVECELIHANTVCIINTNMDRYAFFLRIPHIYNIIHIVDPLFILVRPTYLLGNC